MAKRYKITVTSISPLNVGSKKPYGHFLETMDYIPGAVVRGAFAKLLLEDDSALFESLFASSNNVISFTNLYPTTELSGTNPPRVLPMTAVSCKYEPGFCTGYDKDKERKDTDKPPHGVFDVLIHGLIFDQFGDKLPFAFQPRCPKCGAKVEPISGYYDSSIEEEDRSSGHCEVVDNEYYSINCLKRDCPWSYKRSDTQSQRITKTALNRFREVAQEEMLYSVESISQEQSFVGIVSVLDDDLSEQVEKKFREEEGIRIGGGASRGFGRVDIQVNPFDELDTPEYIKNRIDAFNEKIKEMATFYQFFASEPINPKNGYFTIDFQSDAILLDKSLRSTAKLSAEYLKEALDVDLKIKLVNYYSRMDERSGWSFAPKWKLPKEKEQVLEKGSVFLFQCPEIDKLYEPLWKLQMNGIGEKREEGFGRIMICNPFHEEVYCS